jgi:hypothetical protein
MSIALILGCTYYQNQPIIASGKVYSSGDIVVSPFLWIALKFGEHSLRKAVFFSFVFKAGRFACEAGYFSIKRLFLN